MKDSFFADGSKAWNSGSSGTHLYVKRVMLIIIFLVVYAVLLMFLYNSSSPRESPVISHYLIADAPKNYTPKIESEQKSVQTYTPKIETELETVSKEKMHPYNDEVIKIYNPPRRDKKMRNVEDSPTQKTSHQPEPESVENYTPKVEPESESVPKATIYPQNDEANVKIDNPPQIDQKERIAEDNPIQKTFHQPEPESVQNYTPKIESKPESVSKEKIYPDNDEANVKIYNPDQKASNNAEDNPTQKPSHQPEPEIVENNTPKVVENNTPKVEPEIVENNTPKVEPEIVENNTPKVDLELERVLRKASMEHKTVILTSLNDAWAQPGSIFDLFLESFRVGGSQTMKFLNHLVVVTWDEKAHIRCMSLHKHCYQIETNNFTSEAFFMDPNYLHMVWRKIEFLGSVLQMGYSFVFTDSDIMWLRDPFKHFYKDADFQISCDSFNGNSSDMENLPNSGFSYVKSNDRTIWFYKFWFDSNEPGLKTQDVLNKIKLDPLVSEKKLTIRFLSTRYFGGFCEISKDFKKVSTMHANCCLGLQNKVNDLRLVLDDWRKYMALPKAKKRRSHPSWSIPQSCKPID